MNSAELSNFQTNAELLHLYYIYGICRNSMFFVNKKCMNHSFHHFECGHDFRKTQNRFSRFCFFGTDEWLICQLKASIRLEKWICCT